MQRRRTALRRDRSGRRSPPRVSDYLDQLPDDLFAPWTKQQWTAFYYSPYICVGWPVPDHHEPVLPAGMTFPEIPALILAGQLEPTVSLSKKLLDVFPNGEFYVVPGPTTPPCRSGCAPPSSRPTGSTAPNPTTARAPTADVRRVDDRTANLLGACPPSSAEDLELSVDRGGSHEQFDQPWRKHAHRAAIEEAPGEGRWIGDRGAVGLPCGRLFCDCVGHDAGCRADVADRY